MVHPPGHQMPSRVDNFCELAAVFLKLHGREVQPCRAEGQPLPDRHVALLVWAHHLVSTMTSQDNGGRCQIRCFQLLPIRRTRGNTTWVLFLHLGKTFSLL